MESRCANPSQSEALPEEPTGTLGRREREREDNFPADEMLLCSRDHIIAVIYALPKVCTVLYSAIKP